jgi:hypothetical protein
MFSSRKYFKSIEDVPDAWIFKYYLGLPHDFTGRSLRVKSIFNVNDKTPSMFVYYNQVTNKIVYKCHSTGKSGDGAKLVEELYGLSFQKACEKIVNDYYEFCKTGKYIALEITAVNTRWSVIDFKVRNWYEYDAKFWLQYNIGSSLLKKYEVVPLEYYKVAQVDTETGEVSNVIENFGDNIYGYFNEDKLYKVYNPKAKRFKFFLQDGNYTQGINQLEGHDTLVVASSLKDVMTIKSLGLTIDCVAPNSESTKLNLSQIEGFKEAYKYVITCMDSDDAGIKSMKKYEEEHNLPFIYLPREKDISDIVKHHGKQVALYDFYPKLQNAIEKYVKKNP